MAIETLFQNTFQKGSAETANLGFGQFVGIETYSTKGVAKLTRDTTKVSGSTVVDLPRYFANNTQSDIFALGDTGHVYRSQDTGDTWSDIGATAAASSGNGLICFQGYVFDFRNTVIDYYKIATTTWTTAWKSGLTSAEHFPFQFPNDGFIYFTNGNKIGKLGFGSSPTFDPNGVSGTDYYYNDSWFTLPSFYTVLCMSFLPTNYIALGTGSLQDSQVADVILWNPTLSTYETPLRLYSPAAASQNGVRQIINRNNLLYCITGGNQCIFSTTGTTFRLVEDIGLHTNWRKTTGMQQPYPTFLDPQPKAIALLGNKLLTGVANTNAPASYTNYGEFPMGIWSVAFTESSNLSSVGGDAVQCEFTISTGTTVGTNPYVIGAIQSITQNRALIGWRDNSTYGIDKIDLDNYQNDINAVIIESEMMEIGTPLQPLPITKIEFYFTTTVVSGMTFSVYVRTAFDQDWTLMQAFDPITDGESDSYSSVQYPLEASQYLQLQIKMATSGSVIKNTPQLRNIRIS